MRLAFSQVIPLCSVDNTVKKLLQSPATGSLVLGMSRMHSRPPSSWVLGCIRSSRNKQLPREVDMSSFAGRAVCRSLQANYGKPIEHGLQARGVPVVHLTSASRHHGCQKLSYLKPIRDLQRPLTAREASSLESPEA